MPNKAFLLSVLFLAISIVGVCKIASREVPRVVRTNLENLPMEIEGYMATKDNFPRSVYEELDADQYVYRHYRQANSRLVIDLYIGYYGTAKGGRTGHTPSACLPGSGWGIVKDEILKLSLPGRNSQVEVNYVTAKKDERYNLILHWYQSSGVRVLSSGFEQNLQRLIGLIVKNRNDGAFVRISSNVREEQAGSAILQIKHFAEKVLLLLPEYWPEEA